MSVVSDFQKEFKLFGTYDESAEQYTDGAAYKFNEACKKAKVDVDEILADLIIPKDPTDRDLTDAETEKNTRMQAVIVRGYQVGGDAFDPAADRDVKVAWVKKHLTMAQKIAILSEVQALESLVDGTNPYPDDVFKARKQRSDAKKDCITNGKKLKERYADFLARVKAKIEEDESRISTKNQEITELSKGVAARDVEAKVTAEANNRIEELKNQITVIKKELDGLRRIYGKASAQLDAFEASIDHSLRDNKIFEKDEAKKDDKSEDKDSGASVRSPYSSLSDRGKQAADKEEAKDLYQSFASADTYTKFLMMTGPNARNMMEIARNLAKVGDRKDLQEYCEKIIDSGLIEMTDGFLENFDITVGGNTFEFQALSASTLKNGLSDAQIKTIQQFYERFHTIKLQDLSVEDLAKLQNYSRALLISTTLQEAKWGKGKQITKGWLNFAGRKKSPNYDLGTDVASFLRPFCERKDKIFKDINAEVDKGIDSDDHVKYGYNTKVHHGGRKFENFDHEK